MESRLDDGESSSHTPALHFPIIHKPESWRLRKSERARAQGERGAGGGAGEGAVRASKFYDKRKHNAVQC